MGRNNPLLILSLVIALLAGCAEDAAKPPEAKYNQREDTLMKFDTGKAKAGELYVHAGKIEDYLNRGFFNDAAAKAAHKPLLEAEHKLRRAKGGDDKKTIKDAEEALKKAKEAFAPFAARRDGLLKKRAECIKAVSKAASTDDDKRQIERSFSEGATSEVKTRLHALNAAFKSLLDGMAGPDAARDNARNLDVFVLDDATAMEVRDEIARTMNSTINTFYTDWSAVDFLARDSKSLVEDAISPFIMLKRPEDLGPLKPYVPLTQNEKNLMYETLRLFGARYPDGKIAAEIAALNKGGDTGASVLKGLGDASKGGIPERDVVQMVVNDLRAAYPNEKIEPVKTFRVALVTMYSNASNLSTPNPLALVLAIFGCVVLYGGCAVAVFRAVRSGRTEALPPST
ncbi:MAG: hypothetical protein L6Q71_03155 [Planctomycetes bacterium]|nr:hypothetical protein [Planctomycetota bacterium]NUQ33454.1 hypothetical protein [Planctomycetaceae bacterium]